jgi:hypothetical protein
MFSVPNSAEPRTFVITGVLHLATRLRHPIEFGAAAIPFPKGGKVFQESAMVREVTGHRRVAI